MARKKTNVSRFLGEKATFKVKKVVEKPCYNPYQGGNGAWVDHSTNGSHRNKANQKERNENKKFEGISYKEAKSLE